MPNTPILFAPIIGSSGRHPSKEPNPNRSNKCLDQTGNGSKGLEELLEEAINWLTTDRNYQEEIDKAMNYPKHNKNNDYNSKVLINQFENNK